MKVVCAIIEKESKILIAKNKPERPLGGLWEFPRGKVKSGEINYEAIQREIKEELNIKIKPILELGSLTFKFQVMEIELIAIQCEYISGAFI